MRIPLNYVISYFLPRGIFFIVIYIYRKQNFLHPIPLTVEDSGILTRFRRRKIYLQGGYVMIIRNIKLFKADETFSSHALKIEGDRITGIIPNDTRAAESEVVIDGMGAYAIPGLIDIHFHGALGLDVCDGGFETVRKIAQYEAASGITAICPATLTLPVDELCDILSNMADFRDAASADPDTYADCADLVGINMEGPFISVAKKGAQNPDYIIPCDAGIARRFQDAARGLVKFIGLAPECNPNYREYIDNVKEFANVSLAHTNSDYDTAMNAFRQGACHAVHLFNAMTGFTHREPGVPGAVADSPHVSAEIIADGIHIHPSMVRAAMKFNGESRMILISDSLRSAGMPDGQYELGGQAITKQGRYCRLMDGTIAGSVSNLMDCLRTAVLEMNIPLETAVACATSHPAKALGILDQYGTLETGKYADVVLLDPDLTIRQVIKHGRLI